MSFSVRIGLALSLTLLSLAGCSASHVSEGDAGPRPDAPGSDAACVGSSSLICVPGCGGDAGLPPICVSGAWQCPPGTVDLSTCPPACHGPQPGPGCVCRGTEWSCVSTTCPADIDPWGSPGTPCAVEGEHCTSGGSDACGSAMFCDCQMGHWNCAVAEPDPVCWCGREPSPGDRCNEEGASCGECCPTPGGTGWEPMTCVDGHWQPGACPEIVCPTFPASCPVSRASALGTSCPSEGEICGNPCCGTGFMCSGGAWNEGPDVDCVVCDPSGTFACGDGTCERGQACAAECGPTDGIVHSCAILPDGCTSCDCATPPPGAACEMRDGHPFFTMLGFCG
jgi:hypothetical protein